MAELESFDLEREAPAEFLKLSDVEIRDIMEGLRGWRVINHFATPILDHMYTYDSHEPKPGTAEAKAMATFLEVLIDQVMKTDLARIKRSPSQREGFKTWFSSFISYVGGFVAPHLLTGDKYKAFGDYYHETIQFLNSQSTAVPAPLPSVEYVDGVRVQKLKTGGAPTTPFREGSLTDPPIRKEFDPNTGTFRADIKYKKD